MMLVCLVSGRDEHVVRTDGTVDRWASGWDDTSSGRLTGNLKSSIFFAVQSLLKMIWQVESLFTTSLYISDFVQTQNEAKILTFSVTYLLVDQGCYMIVYQEYQVSWDEVARQLFLRCVFFSSLTSWLVNFLARWICDFDPITRPKRVSKV